MMVLKELKKNDTEVREKGKTHPLHFNAKYAWDVLCLFSGTAYQFIQRNYVLTAGDYWCHLLMWHQ